MFGSSGMQEPGEGDWAHSAGKKAGAKEERYVFKGKERNTAGTGRRGGDG